MVEKTRMPVPEIVAYAIGDTSGQPLSSFLIFRYIQSERLSYAQLKTLSDEQRMHLYTSFVDIHIQLQKPIGCLVHGPPTRLSSSQEDCLSISICKN